MIIYSQHDVALTPEWVYYCLMGDLAKNKATNESNPTKSFLFMQKSQIDSVECKKLRPADLRTTLAEG